MHAQDSIPEHAVLDTLVHSVPMVQIQPSAATPVTPIINQTTAATRKFGYLSYNSVLQQMPEYAEAQANVAKLKSYYDDEMTRAEQEFSKKFAEYVDGQKDMPENIMLKRQKELQQLMEQSLAFKSEAQRLLTKSEEELMEPLREKLYSAIQTVGLQNNYSYVLNTDSNAYPFINPNEGVDITTQVLSALK